MKPLIVIKTIADIKKLRKTLQGTLGFIPTMGFLHEGHLSLIKLAQEENDHVVVSIFVNPKQFGPQEDYAKYPRGIDQDLSLLKSIHTDIVFLPTVEELYPSGYKTYITVEELSNHLEGKSRPGHFTGVATIVAKLFNIVQPTRAYFGQKDAQQVVIIKKMVSDLDIPVNIIVGKTMRESSGLAMSSRNVFLNKEERKESVILFQSLQLAQELFNNGERNAEKIILAMKKLLHTTAGKIDYISITDVQSLEKITTIQEKALVSLAVYFWKTRLIDNVILGQ